MMNLSSAMLMFIAAREGEGDGDKKTPGLQPYLDLVNIWTVGFGHVIYHEGRRLEGEADFELAYELFPGLTRTEAVELLREDCELAVAAVNEGIAGVPTTQSEFDAMCSICFNVGKANFLKSSLLRYHRRGSRAPAAGDPLRLVKLSKEKLLPGNAPDQFFAWSFVKKGTVWVQGLYNRRGEERSWYLRPI